MEDYPSNSNYTRENKLAPEPVEPKKVEKVIEGKVIRRKTPLGKKIKDLFIGGDARSVGAYVMYDVLLPAAKDALADAMSQGVERILFGEVRSTRRRQPGRYSSQYGYVAYNRPSNPPWETSRREDRGSGPSRRSRMTHNFDEIVLATRPEAEAVIDQLFTLISKYETASVADLYELVGITAQYTDDKWGWVDIRGAGVTRVRDGYLLDLPRPEPLEK